MYGVGPVKFTFQHEGGAGAQLTSGELLSTNLPAKAPPSDANYFPLIAGANGKFRWTNARYFKQPVVQSYKVDQAANDSPTANTQPRSTSPSPPTNIAAHAPS